MKAFRIAQWDESHETSESRKYKTLTWVAVPNKHDGLGFSQLKTEADRVELYCGWCLMLQLASRSPCGWRGWLVRAGRPLDAKHMAVMTGFPESIFIKALEYFSRPDVAWLRTEELAAQQEMRMESPGAPAKSPVVPGESPGAPAKSPVVPGESPNTEQNRTEQNRTGITEPQNNNNGAGSLQNVEASKAQFAALSARCSVLEKLGRDATPFDKAELRKKRAILRQVQKNQENGIWTVVQASE